MSIDTIRPQIKGNIMNSLANEAIKRTLATLHAESSRDDERWAERRRRQAAETQKPGPDPLIRMGELYISVSPSDGQLLYLFNAAKRSQLIVEFGASYGISAIYPDTVSRIFIAAPRPKTAVVG